MKDNNNMNTELNTEEYYEYLRSRGVSTSFGFNAYFALTLFALVTILFFMTNLPFIGYFLMVGGVLVVYGIGTFFDTNYQKMGRVTEEYIAMKENDWPVIDK